MMQTLSYFFLIYLYGSAAEWFTHKFLMHQRTKSLSKLAEDHKQHHKTYPYGFFSKAKDPEFKYANIVLCLEHVLTFIIPAAIISLFYDPLLSLFLGLFGFFHFYYYNAMHSAMHLRQKIKFLPKWFISLCSWNHFMHHQHPNKFYCVTMPGVDFLLGSWCQMTSNDRKLWEESKRQILEDNFGENYKSIKKLDRCLLSKEWLSELNDGHIPQQDLPNLGYFANSFVWKWQLGKLHLLRLQNLASASKPFIIASNHASWLDIFIFYEIAKFCGLKMRIMAAESVLKFHPLIGLLFARGMGCYPAATGKAILSSIKLLKEGSNLAICPEGWAYFSEQPIHEFKTGTVRIAKETGVPIVPIGIYYSNRPPKWIEKFPFPLQCVIAAFCRMFRGEVFVTFGPAIHIGPNDDVKEKTQILRAHVEVLYDISRQVKEGADEGR